MNSVLSFGKTFLTGARWSSIDTVSGNLLCTWSCSEGVYDCKFVSDEEFVVSCSGSLSLFNIKSGNMLSVIGVENIRPCLAACSSKRLIAVGLKCSKPGFKVIRVWLPGDKYSRKIKR